MILYPLCLEYKVPKYAEKPRAWAAARTQLTNYMRSIHSVPKGAGTIYGAIVIGL